MAQKELELKKIKVEQENDSFYHKYQSFIYQRGNSPTVTQSN